MTDPNPDKRILELIEWLPGGMEPDAALLRAYAELEDAVYKKHRTGLCDCEYTDATGEERIWHAVDPVCKEVTKIQELEP